MTSEAAMPSPSSSRGPGSGKPSKSLAASRTMTSPHKKASPSDVIFGKPPGSDSPSRAFEALNTDGNSASASTSVSSSGSNNEGSSGRQSVTMAASSTAVDNNGSSSITSEQTTNGAAYSDNRAASSSSQPVTSRSSLSEPDCKLLPPLFEDVDADDIVVLVADMLTRLTTHNDQLPLHPTSLTRFHSRATPSITVLSYLKRITKYTSLQKSCTLILLVYIDRVCERISGFTICSLTVHRFIVAAVVCASKALCDSFSTNGHYARVGGISLIELNMLEKEFLNIINWKLSCSGALLQHYYTSLVESHHYYRIDSSQISNESDQQLRKKGGKNDEDTAPDVQMSSTSP